MSRGLGILLGGTVRDIVTLITGDMGLGYITVFVIEAGLLIVSMLLLNQINITEFRTNQPNLVELAALTGDA